MGTDADPPLNQIRNYIERVKLGKDADLRVNRRDEIGELADALVSMREELRKQKDEGRNDSQYFP